MTALITSRCCCCWAQINNVNAVLGANAQQRNEEKNQIVSFLKDNHLDDELIQTTVR